MKKILSFFLIAVFSITAIFAGHVEKPLDIKKKPKRKIKTTKKADKRFRKLARKKIDKDRTKSKRRGKLGAKRKERAKKQRKSLGSRNPIYDVYPPYMDAWAQQWTEENGSITEAQAYTDGYTYQTAGSYSYGMATSRCWVACTFIPNQTGWYNLTLHSYLEVSLRINAYYSGDEAYAYATLAVGSDKDGWQEKTVIEEYTDVAVKNKLNQINDWASVTKRVNLIAGRTYTFTGYVELGGWSTGSQYAWQNTNGVCNLEPFEFEFIGH